ncbi:kinase-like domain-containing protein [Crassisporium funariophilum]|nr:kinase-like domain-containing protein [Crassisporium funariophilum]
MFPPSKLGEYTVIQDIAEGTFGTVKMAKHTVTGRTVAMKSVSKALFYSPYNSVAPEEFGYMRTFQHPHIIRIYEVISTPTHFILVLEYAPGELFNYIVTHGRMDVPLARKLLHQMISAIETMYHLEYLHLDLKPGNILLDDNLNLKITDFGVSNYIVDFHNLLTRRASEVVRGTVYATPQCDVWSSGVILYVMLCGKLPFENGNVQVPFSKMSKGTLHLPSHLSEDARTLITSMLAVDPVKRITIPNIVQHPFFTTDLPHHAPPPWRFKQYTGYKKPSFSRSLQESKAPEVKSIEDLGKEVVDELAHSMIGVNGDEIWQCLLSDDVQGNSVKVAYMLLQDKNTLLRDKKKQLRRDPWEYAEANYFGKSRFEDKINVEYEDIDPEDDPPESISSPISNESETNFGILHTSLPQQSPENVLEQHHLASYFLANRSGAQEKQKPRTKWHFGIRSTSPPMHVMLEIYRTLKTLGMEWKEKTDLGGLGGVYSKPAGLKGGDVDGEPREPINFKAASCIYFVETRARVQDVVLLMDLQLYMIDSSNYLVDFHHKKSYQANTAPGAGKFDLAPKNSASSRVSNDASPLGKDKERDSLETMHEDEVTSPYIFLDVTSRLILELAGGGE